MPEYTEDSHALSDALAQINELQMVVARDRQMYASQIALERAERQNQFREMREREFVGGDVADAGIDIPGPTIPAPPVSDSGSGGGFTETPAPFTLYVSGGVVKMKGGTCYYYQGAADTWDADPISTQTVGNGYWYIKRTLTAGDAATHTLNSAVSYAGMYSSATGDTDVFPIGYVSGTTYQNFYGGPVHEKRMA